MEEIRLSKSGKATYILAVACLAFAGIGIQQIILSAGIYSWYHIPVLLGLSCMAAGPFILVELRITRSVSTRNGLLLMRTFGRKNRVGVSLGEALYYEVLSLRENFRESPRRFLVVSNHPFPSLRRGGAFTLVRRLQGHRQKREGDHPALRASLCGAVPEEAAYT